MRSWSYWSAVVVAGLVIGGAGATGVLHVSGLDAPAKQRLQTEPLAADLSNPAAENNGAAKALRPADGGSASPGRQQATPTPVPTPSPPKSLFDDSQIVSYYGHPLAAAMGVLGEGSQDQMIARLKNQVAAYQAVNPDKKVVPALHLIYEVAQALTSDDGLYLYRTEDATVQQYINLTRDNDMLLFLDLQIGRSTLQNELQYVLPYLKYPWVHLAIDPEFVTPPGMRPGQDIGTLDSSDINFALDKVEHLVEQERLPNKIVIVHQFQFDMLTNKEALNFNEPRVDVVLNMDGFGDQTGKLSKYDTLIKQFGAKYGGIKLFYKFDTNLLTEQQVEDLDPRPSVIMYQ